MTHKPTVFVVDDDIEVRRSMRWLCESVNLAVETYASAESFLNAYDPVRPGCLVLDVRMPGMNGLELQKKLFEEKCHLPIIIVSAFADVPVTVRAMKAGAVTLIEKPYKDQMLIDQIQDALERDEVQLRAMNDQLDIDDRLALLTPREREVMNLVVTGNTAKQAAQILNISPKTIDVHRSHIMKKMRADTIAELVRMVMTAGRS